MNLDVFLTKQCNMKCVFCGAWVEEKCSELLPEELEIIFQEGKKYGFRYTTLSGGEPLLYKDFRRAVEIGLKYGFWINITTNGLLINQDLCDFLSHKNVNFRVSLHTLDCEKHKNITGTDSWNTVVDHIQLLHRNQMYFSLGCTLYDDNAEEVEDMVDFAFKSGAAYIRFTPVVGVNKGSQYETDWNFYKDILRRITREVLKYKKYIAYEKSQFHHTKESKSSFISLMTTRRCPSGSNLFMIVDSEHNVLPCQFIPQKDDWYQPCNNVCDITNSFNMLREKMKKNFQSSMEKEHKGECKDCEYLQTCLGGCLANRLPKNKTVEDEQDMCMLKLVTEILDELTEDEKEFLLDYWRYYFNQRITKQDKNIYCMRKLPIWEINFRMDLPRVSFY